MRSLRRLGIWGSSATLALVVAVAASYSNISARRPAVATSDMSGGASTQKADARLTQSSASEAEVEVRRLAEAVRLLADDRQRLLARIDTIEHSLEDITGSIQRQAATSTPDAPLPSTRASPVTPASQNASAPADPSLSADTPAHPAPKPEPVAQEQTAGTTLTPPGDIREPAKSELGIDIGGAVSFDGLRLLWTSVKGTNADLFEGLRPLVVARENGRTKGAELRLVVGPMADIEAATRFCATLAASRRYCQPVGYEGQRLADAALTAERKPAPKPAPRSVAPAVRSPRLFQ